MSFDELMQELKARRLILVSSSELWPDRKATKRLQREVKRHMGAISALMAYGDIRVCASPMLHRPYWKYIGKHYVCEVCQRLTVDAA